MTIPNPDDTPESMFQRLTGSLPPGLRQVMDAYAAQCAQQQEMGQIDMRMQATALHEYFALLVGAGFTEAQALFYLAKLTPGL